MATATAAEPAEELVKEFFSTLSVEQKRKVLLPWDYPAKKGGYARLTMTDSAINYRIGGLLRKPQQELVERMLRALCADVTTDRRGACLGVSDRSKLRTTLPDSAKRGTVNSAD